MIDRVDRFLALLGGGDETLLAQVPQERARFVQMAGILLTTAIVAVASMIFATHYALQVSLVPSILFGLLWGIIILNLDRFLVLSIGATRDRGRLALLALPRLLLAVVLALVISTPLVLRIFATDINAQLSVMQLQQSKEVAALQAKSAGGQQAVRLQNEINVDESILNSHSSGTSKLHDAALRELPVLLTQYRQLEAQLQAESVNADRVVMANTGLLAQLQALSEASAQDYSLEVARLAVLALFFLIEILPVTVKVLTNLGPLSAYEIVAKLEEEELTDSARARRIESRRIEERKSRTRMNVEEDMRIREEGLGRRTNEHVASEMAKVLDAALREWSDKLHAGLSSGDENGGSETQPIQEASSASVQINPGFGLPNDGKL